MYLSLPGNNTYPSPVSFQLFVPHAEVTQCVLVPDSKQQLPLYTRMHQLYFFDADIKADISTYRPI